MVKRAIMLAAAVILAACGGDSMESIEGEQLALGPPDGHGQEAELIVEIENVSTVYPFLKSGIFNTPVGASGPGPLLPGQTYMFSFTAGIGSRLSFATMFVPSNDLFYGPSAAGIPLYDGTGQALSGDITDEVILWDAGTEVNEEPGVGPNQPMRQAGPDTGADENGIVQPVASSGDGYTYPAVEDVLSVLILPGPDFSFTVYITNVSDSTTLMPSNGDDQAVPLAPGVYAVHGAPDALFANGAANYGHGLEALAEDGNPGPLGTYLAANTGVTSPIAPGVFALHRGPNPLFKEGFVEGGHGLEGLAEDASPGMLFDYVADLRKVVDAGVYNTPVGARAAGPILPGQRYEFSIVASPGERLSFASMYGQSNDLFFGNGKHGIDLFGPGGEPVSGEVTMYITLWDAGTEINQEPGVGNDQAPRQSGPDTGAEEMEPVIPVYETGDGFNHQATPDVIKVTITPVI